MPATARQATTKAIAGVISQGAPAYNEGDIEKCYRLYQQVAKQLIDEHKAAGRSVVMATTTPLHLIEPLGFSLEDKLLQRAGHEVRVLNPNHSTQELPDLLAAEVTACPPDRSRGSARTRSASGASSCDSPVASRSSVSS